MVDTTKLIEQEIEKKKKEITNKKNQIKELEYEITILESLPAGSLLPEFNLKEIEDFDTGIAHFLSLKNIYTVSDLTLSSESEIAKIRNIGPCKIKKIKEWLQKHSLQFLE